jgi:hypothetical protein
LQDEGKRKAYDLTYHSIKRTQTEPEKPFPQPPRSTSASPPESEASRELAQIAALRKAKAERNAQWRVTQTALEQPIFELRRTIRWLEQEINDLANIEAAEWLEETRKNDRKPWVLSSLYKQVKASEEGEAHKEKERQERRVQKELKERRLGIHQAELLEKTNQMRETKKSIDAENTRDNQSIKAIEARKRSREERERRDRENEEQTRLAKARRKEQAQANIARQRQEQWQKAAQKAREDSSRAQVKARATMWAKQEQDERSQGRPWDDMNSDVGWNRDGDWSGDVDWSGGVDWSDTHQQPHAWNL